MAFFGDDKIEELRTRADIVEVIGAHVRLRKAGRNWVGLCPFHNEKTPSFSVNAERGFFHCFGCGAGGTVFNFLIKMEGMTFPDAVRSLASRYGVELPETSAQGAQRGERDLLYNANGFAAEFFAHVLWKSEEGASARAYLKSREIDDSAAREFQLGFAPARGAALATALERRKLLDAGVKVGLVKRDTETHDMFRARVMFPIRDAQGRVIAFGGRALDERQPKYLNSPESPLYSKSRALYGVFEARKAIASRDRAFVVEGYFDVIALVQAGIREAVAGCGTALTADQLRILGRQTKNIIACFDGDSAGRKASLRAVEIFLEAGILGRAMFIPEGDDPDTFVRKNGVAAFDDLASRAQLLVDYFLADAVANARGDVNGRARAAERVAALLRQVRNPFEFDLLARKAADVLGVSESLLRSQSRQGGATSRTPVSRTTPDKSKLAAPDSHDAATKAEIGLVALALIYPASREAIAASRIYDDFVDRELAGALVDICSAEDRAIPIDQFIDARLSEENQIRLSAAAVEPESDEAGIKLIAGNYITAIERRRGRREHAEMVRSAADASALNTDDAAAAAQAAILAIKRSARS